MRILITGGGTAGHVTPLLAVVSKIKEIQPTAVVRYAGERGKRSINSLVKDNLDIDKSYYIFAGKLRRYYGKSLLWYITQPKLLILNIRDLLYLLLGIIESIAHFIVWRPDVVFAKGGYVSLPIGLSAALLRIPLVIHDSDAIPGLTNRILSRYAKKIGVGQSINNYPQYQANKLVFCGIPISDLYYNPPLVSESKKILGVSNSERLIVIIGGSLGAVRLNNSIMACLDNIMLDRQNRIYWLSGSNSNSEISSYIKDKKYKQRITLETFSNNLPNILNAAEVVISRAGATSLAELATLAKPAILVPNPYLTGGHQVTNAEYYANKNAAIVIHESELVDNPLLLYESLNRILNNRQYKKQLTTNISKYAIKDSATVIAKLILNSKQNTKETV